MARHYGWCCYRLNVEPRGRCAHCGGEIAEPPGTSYESRLVWALDHPDPDRAVTAARILGRVGGEASLGALREAALRHRDPYVAAEALRSVVSRTGPRVARPLLDQVEREGGVVTRAVARQTPRPGRR